MNPIAHALACRSDFSLGESTLSVKKLVTAAKEKGYETLGLADTMTISGMPDFIAACKKEGIRPITGVTLRVYDNSTWRKPKAGEPGPTKNPMHTLKAFVRTEAGLKQLYSLLSLANDADHFYYNSRVSMEEVLTHLRPGDIEITTGDFHSLLCHPEAQSRCQALAMRFGRIWIEVVPINTPLYDTLNSVAKQIVDFLGPIARPVCTYPALYPEGGADSADVLRAISTNDEISSPWLPRPYVRDFSFVEPKALVQRCMTIKQRGDVDGAFLAAAVRGISDFVQGDFYVFEKKQPCLPQMAQNEFEALVAQCKLGWTERFSAPVMGHQPTKDELNGIYRQRLVFELGVLRSMNFSGYFLLVQEIVNWSKQNGVGVGPGRGSAGGSLVAYLMQITDVDPIRFNLLFERFINPERLDLPDADLDFMSSRRHEVIEHIEARYGKEFVAGISNYSALGAASAIRDVGRVHGLHPFDYACSKQVEKEHGVALSLEESRAVVPDIEKYAAAHPVQWQHSLNLEGCMRGLGRHAAGVVIAGEPIVNRAVVETRSGGATVNWDKRSVEDHGLIKIDVLGLSTLDTIHLALGYIRDRHKRTINLLALPLDDKRTLEAFGHGNTVGVFQFESGGMKKLLSDLAVGGPLTFEDLCAVTALFRPGPLDAGLTDQYIAVKQGRQSVYFENPNMKASLETTYGVIVYQEQVMQLARDLSGFTLAESDHLRKAIGKKDKEKMESMGEKFIEGAVSVSGMDRFAASSLWDKIVGFAGYAFNRSHSVAYSVISYQAMWLKTNYPAEFYAASMSVVDDASKLATLVADARRQQIEVLPPDINWSTDRIEIRGERELIAPFQAVKGISATTAQRIVEIRQSAGGSFRGLAHVEAFVTENKVGAKFNKAARDRLAQVGAFHSVDGGLSPLHPDRLRDRLELMPGFTVDMVKAERKIERGNFVLAEIVKAQAEVKSCDGCSLKDAQHVAARMGRSPKFMMVFDSPSFQEEKAGKMFEGDGASYVKAAMRDQGLSLNDGYYTSVVRAVRPKGQKTLTSEQINGCTRHLTREIELLKPPVIIAMGAAATKFFAPNIKGNPSDLIGKVIFDPKLDASIVFGFNPVQVLFDASKVTHIQNLMTKVNELVN